MANVDAPFGLKPIRHLNGNPWNGVVKRVYFPAGDGTAAFVGDAVILNGSADTEGVCPTVIRATVGADNPIYGVVVAFEPDPTNLQLLYRVASTARYAYVCCDPDVVFAIQDDGVVTLTAADVGLNAVLIATHSGSTTTGKSGLELNSSNVAATANFQLLILSKWDSPNNELGARAIWEVVISRHQLRPIAGVLGIA